MDPDSPFFRGKIDEETIKTMSKKMGATGMGLGGYKNSLKSVNLGD
jgi:hypothetical protein